jgi:hypothetical protein
MNNSEHRLNTFRSRRLLTCPLATQCFSAQLSPASRFSLRMPAALLSSLGNKASDTKTPLSHSRTVLTYIIAWFLLTSHQLWGTTRRLLNMDQSAFLPYELVLKTKLVTQNETPFINLLKPTGHVIHQQFNIQQLYALPTLYLCVMYLSENKERLVPLTA